MRKGGKGLEGQKEDRWVDRVGKYKNFCRIIHCKKGNFYSVITDVIKSVASNANARSNL